VFVMASFFNEGWELMFTWSFIFEKHRSLISTKVKSLVYKGVFPFCEILKPSFSMRVKSLFFLRVCF
jgi:hypothetical protein